jgi:monofunctional glycosyltransferase
MPDRSETTSAAERSTLLHRCWYRDDARKPWIRRTLSVLFVLLVPLPILYLLIFRFVPVPGTPQMLLKRVTLNPVHYSWQSYDDISPALKRSVIASEDQKFCRHHGFDWDNIEKAASAHEHNPHKHLRGASTISQQVARTLFLLPVRSWVRKGVEAYLTVLVEALWPKRRIYAAYLNLVDWGNGNFGAEAAAENYFGISAAELDKTQAARLATILPNPDKWKAAHPGRYVARRSKVVRSRAYEVSRDGLDACLK